MSVQYGNRGVVKNNLQFYINQNSEKSFRGEATTNLVSAGYESFETPVASYNTSAQFTAIRSNEVSYFGNTSLLCTRGTFATDAYADMEGSIAVAPNTTYTLSSYVYLTELKTNLNLLRVVYLDNISYLGETQVGIANDNLLTSGDLNQWKRKYVTFTTPSNCNNVVCRYHMDQTSAYFPTTYYVDGRQLEQKSYMTPFVSGSRTNMFTGGGGLRDLTANGNNANLTGAALFFNATGFYTTGSNPGGNDVGVTITPFSTGFTGASNGSRTYDIWVRLLGTNNGASILFGRTGDVIDGFLQGASPSFTNYINYVYYYSPNKTAEAITFNGNLNQWYHAVATIDTLNSKSSLYINSNLHTSKTLTGSLYPVSGNYFLNGNTGYNVPDAIVDQVRVYNTVLTPEEIKQNFLATKSAYGYV